MDVTIERENGVIQIPGRVLFQDMEIQYQGGRLGYETVTDELIVKLKAIAAVFGANVYDCGQKVD